MNETLNEVRRYPLREVLRRFLPLVRPHRLRCLLAAALVAVVGLAVALHPLFAKYVIDEAIPRRSFGMALAAAAVFLAVMGIRMTLWFLAMTIIYRVQQAIVFDLRSSSFAHLQRLCLRFHSRFSSGFIYERVFGNSINTLGTFMQLVFSQFVAYAVGLLFSLGFCLYLSPMLTAVIMAGCIAYVAAARLLARRIYDRTRESNEANMTVVGAIMDKLRGLTTIRSFALEDRMQEELNKQLQPAMHKWIASVLESLKLNFVTEGLGYLVTATVIVTGAWLVMSGVGRFPIGTLVAFMGYQATLISMISAITVIFGQVMSARTAFDQLYSVLDTQSSVPDRPGAVMPENPRPRLELRNVTFAYGKEPVLRNISLEIPERRSLALVGRSGSGKSTLASLLLRFYDPAEGAILLDGHKISDLPARDYRGLFGVVLQDPFLFDTTILENLRMVRPEADEQAIAEALRQAGAWEFVEQLPDAVRYRVGEGGCRLSGGQRQRVALARCLLTSSRIVILDEATSALDAESEKTAQKGIEAICCDRTLILIAHRLSTIRHADRIVVMDLGRIVEQGSFEELLERGGHFARLHAIATSTSTRRLKLGEAGFA